MLFPNIEDFAIAAVVTVNAADTVRCAIESMSEHDIRDVVVVGTEAGRFGIFTATDLIRQHIPEVLDYADFLVLDQRMTVSVQPAVPIPSGYAAYWPFRADGRHVIDLTLGVMLSDPDKFDILGYVALPRWLAGSRTMRVGPTSSRTDMFGRCDLDFLRQLL